jgi:hypothetical protein
MSGRPTSILCGVVLFRTGSPAVLNGYEPADGANLKLSMFFLNEVAAGLRVKSASA